MKEIVRCLVYSIFKVKNYLLAVLRKAGDCPHWVEVKTLPCPQPEAMAFSHKDLFSSFL